MSQKVTKLFSKKKPTNLKSQKVVIFYQNQNFETIRRFVAKLRPRSFRKVFILPRKKIWDTCDNNCVLPLSGSFESGQIPLFQNT